MDESEVFMSPITYCANSYDFIAIYKLRNYMVNYRKYDKFSIMGAMFSTLFPFDGSQLQHIS